MGSGWGNRATSTLVPLGGGAAYFLLASATIHLTTNGRTHATVWAADAVVLALLLARPRHAWPTILLAAWGANFAANALARAEGSWLLLYGAINMAQVLLAAHMIRRGDGDTPRDGVIADGRGLVRFILWAGVAAPAGAALLGALVGSASVGLPFAETALRWYGSNALGLLVVTPFLADFLSGDYGRAMSEHGRAGHVEAAALLSLTATVAVAVFAVMPVPMLFVTFIPVLAVAFRLGRLGVQAAVVTTAAIGAVSTMRGIGPFAQFMRDPTLQTYGFQVYLAGLTLTALPVAAAIAARHAALLRLHEKEEALRLLMAHSADVLLRFDPTGTCLSAHGPVGELIGVGPHRLVGRRPLDPDAGGDPALYAAFACAIATQTVRATEFVLPHRPHVTLEVAFKAVLDDGTPSAVVATVRDISARKQAEAALVRAADTDSLTGLLNRAGFDKALHARLAATPGPATLAMIDVDRFKAINDANGHPFGDTVLIEIARRLQAGTRGGDIVARLGGDEFVILFASDEHDARHACDRIAQAVARQPVLRDDRVAVLSSISCGVAAWHPATSPAQLVRAADVALYEAKRNGRNCVRLARRGRAVVLEEGNDCTGTRIG